MTAAGAAWQTQRRAASSTPGAFYYPAGAIASSSIGNVMARAGDVSRASRSTQDRTLEPYSVVYVPVGGDGDAALRAAARTASWPGPSAAGTPSFPIDAATASAADREPAAVRDRLDAAPRSSPNRPCGGGQPAAPIDREPASRLRRASLERHARARTSCRRPPRSWQHVDPVRGRALVQRRAAPCRTRRTAFVPVGDYARGSPVVPRDGQGANAEPRC